MRVPVLTYFLMGISYIGTPFAVVGIIALFYWNINKKLAYGMSFSFFVSCLLCQGIKIIARVPRPWLLDPTFSAVDIAIPSAGGYSFPSIHTAGSTALYISMFLFYKKKGVRSFCLGLLSLIIFSRMYLGCHTPLDVTVAFIITLITTLVITFFWNRYGDQKKDDVIVAFFLGALAVALLVLDGSLFGNGTVDFSNAKDGFETAGLALGFVFGFPLERRSVNFVNEAPGAKKALRFIIGLAVALIIELGFKLLNDTNVFLIIFRYALNGFWITYLWPKIFTRYENVQKKPAV